MSYYNKICKIMAWFEEKPPTPYDKICISIVKDEDLFNHIGHYVSGDPEALNDHPALTKKLESWLKKIPPISSHPSLPLYRGESANQEQIRSVQSWTPIKEVALDFAKNVAGSVVLRTKGPVQGVSLQDLAHWRMREFPDESHYSGGQAEWLVLRPKNIETVYSKKTGWMNDTP